MKALRTIFIIIGLVLSINITFAQDETPEVVSTVTTVIEETPTAEDTGAFAIDESIMMLLSTLFSVLGVTVIAGISVYRNGGNVKDALRASAESGLRGILTNEGLSGTIETRLLSIPQKQRDWLIELVNLTSPLTDTSTISTDAATWVRNVLDGNLETGAIVAQSTRDTFETIDDKPIDAVG
jgi:hypothetical protein